jgi:predicted DNA binding protein
MGIDKFYRKGYFPKVNTPALQVGGVDVEASADEINLLKGLEGIPKVVQVEVDCSGGGSAQTEDIVVLPAGSIILNVVALVTETFDGDTTKTLEVGVSGNADNYIDTIDLGTTKDTFVDMISGTNNDNTVVEAILTETTIIATWTNSANATAGKVKVTILYI